MEINFFPGQLFLRPSNFVFSFGAPVYCIVREPRLHSADATENPVCVRSHHWIQVFTSKAVADTEHVFPTGSYRRPYEKN